MWLWEAQLVELGLRRCSKHYWKCERRYGLWGQHHLSFFEGFHKQIQGSSAPLRAVELESFHVTFCLGVERIHFYYREGEGGCWSPEGHTPSWAIRAEGHDPVALMEDADGIAAAFVQAMSGRWEPREMTW